MWNCRLLGLGWCEGRDLEWERKRPRERMMGQLLLSICTLVPSPLDHDLAGFTSIAPSTSFDLSSAAVDDVTTYLESRCLSWGAWTWTWGGLDATGHSGTPCHGRMGIVWHYAYRVSQFKDRYFPCRHLDSCTDPQSAFYPVIYSWMMAVA